MESLVAALACLALLYTLMPRLPRGLPRLFLLLPCLPVFAWVPFSTRSHSMRAILSFSFLWIGPSKLLLLCWDLSPDYSLGHGFLYFMVTTVLPLCVKGKASTSAVRTKQGALFPQILKISLFFVILNALQYRERLSVWAIHALNCFLVLLGLEWVLGFSAKLANMLLGVETYPAFDNPFLASSLSEFWSRRWNLVATHMLRETVYAPILRRLSRRQGQDTGKHTFDTRQSHRKAGLGNAGTTSTSSASSNQSIQIRGSQKNSILEQKLQQESPLGMGYGKSGSTARHPLPARAIAVLASFLASGLIHELIFCCINQSTRSTWEVTMFFVLHGFATVLEGFLRTELPAGWKLPRPVAIFCTFAFLFFSSAWLFMPPITRAGSDLRIIEEFHHTQIVILHLFKRLA